MPQLGETVIEGTILKWLKAEGEHIDLDEPLFEISTDKVDTEVPSPAAGTLSKILVAEGATVAVGTPLAEIEDGSGSGSVGTAAATAAASLPSSPPSSVGESSEGRDAGSAVAASAPAVPRSPVPDGGARSQILSPLVRKLAAEHDVDLSKVTGTGTGGRITKSDVLAVVEAGGGDDAAPAASSTGQAAPALARGGEREDVVPMSHIRKAIAEHMTASLRTSARAWNMVEVDMEHVVRIRERAMPFVSRAACEALLAHPMVNAELRGEEVVVRRYVNLGIAVSYDEGLIVPVVKDADSMNLVGLARTINDVAVRARAKRLKPDEVHGGTFSITNPGPFGSIMSVPIINQPQSAILAFDAVQKRPVVIDDAIAIRHMVYLSMSWDHRVIDGALASQFLARIKENLETWDFAEDLGV